MTEAPPDTTPTTAPPVAGQPCEADLTTDPALWGCASRDHTPPPGTATDPATTTGHPALQGTGHAPAGTCAGDEHLGPAVTGLVHDLATGRPADHQTLQSLSVHLGPDRTTALLRAVQAEHDGRGGGAGGIPGAAGRRPRPHRTLAQRVIHWYRRPIAEGPGLTPITTALEKLAGRQRLDRSDVAAVTRLLGRDAITIIRTLCR